MTRGRLLGEIPGRGDGFWHAFRNVRATQRLPFLNTEKEDEDQASRGLIGNAIRTVLTTEPYKSVFLQGGQSQVRIALLKNRQLLSTDPEQFAVLFPQLGGV